jgi:hypothetical protein
MQQGKGFMVYCQVIAFPVAQKTGYRELFIVPALFINHWTVIIADKFGAIETAAQWALIAEMMVIINDIENIFTLPLDFLLELA